MNKQFLQELSNEYERDIIYLKRVLKRKERLWNKLNDLLITDEKEFYGEHDKNGMLVLPKDCEWE